MKALTSEYLSIFRYFGLIMNITHNKKAYFIALYFHYLDPVSHYDFTSPLLTKYYKHYGA
mgnify:CR=1 FL=1